MYWKIKLILTDIKKIIKTNYNSCRAEFYLAYFTFHIIFNSINTFANVYLLIMGDKSYGWKFELNKPYFFLSVTEVIVISAFNGLLQ